MTTLKNKKGVSLVELIAVIVIMGIIATVGGVAVASIIENSNKSAAVTAVSDVFSAGKNYLQSNPNDDAVTLSELKTAGYIEEATYNKFMVDGTLNEITVSVANGGVVYSITDSKKVDNTVQSGKYPVVYANGKFTVKATEKAPTDEA